ncbi:MAG: YHS domain protein [Cytophagales bacterium]|nr:YHS domain protein [Cytophagales bacterium]
MKSFDHPVKILFAFLWILIKCPSAYAQDLPAGLYNLENHVAIQGYDPVSYFTMKRPVRGSEEFQTEIRGAKYLFVSKEHLEIFKKNPVAYEPQYGGWCAYAIGLSGSKVRIDPKTYKIIHGRLYLFYNFYLTNTLKKWNKNEEELLKNADKHWEEIVRQFQ